MKTPPGWRLIDHSAQPLHGARNMAIDDALLRSVGQGGPPTLRLYRWSPACLSFGRNQHACGTYDAGRLRTAGIDVVRRPTGGLAVLHDDELTYAVAAPASLLGGPRAGYALINRALVHGLCALGVPAAVAIGSGAPHPFHDTASPCFQAPSPGEVVAGGRKLVGSAQRCEKRTVLQHGSILVGGSQAAVAEFLSVPAREAVDAGAPGPALPRARPRARPATPPVAPSGAVTLRELLGEAPAVSELSRAVAAGFVAVLGTSLALSQLSDEEEAVAAGLEHSYAGEAWTWRR
jgi:lipoyl(octanoyl) transferase